MSSVPASTTVLNTTAPSNFTYIDRLDLLDTLPRVCTVPEVRRELRAGADAYPYLERALNRLSDAIPVVTLAEELVQAAADLGERLDPGEAQAFAVAANHDGTLVTDDGRARSLAREADVSVTGSIGVLVRAVDSDRISESAADRWLKQWIDDTEYRAPSREFSDYL